MQLLRWLLIVITMNLERQLRKDKLYKKIRKEDNLLFVSFKSEALKNEAKKVIKEDLPDLVIAEGSEQELENRT